MTPIIRPNSASFPFSALLLWIPAWNLTLFPWWTLHAGNHPNWLHDKDRLIRGSANNLIRPLEPRMTWPRVIASCMRHTLLWLMGKTGFKMVRGAVTYKICIKMDPGHDICWRKYQKKWSSCPLLKFWSWCFQKAAMPCSRYMCGACSGDCGPIGRV